MKRLLIIILTAVLCLSFINAPECKTYTVNIRELNGKWSTIDISTYGNTFSYENCSYEIVYDDGTDKYVGIPIILVNDQLKRIDTLSLTMENYYAICEMYEIREPEYVYAQSCLESGYFTSYNYRIRNNHLGLMRGGKHMEFDYWADCIRCYAGVIESRRKPNEDFFLFLKRIGYAGDINYNEKIRKIVRKNQHLWDEVFDMEYDCE